MNEELKKEIEVIKNNLNTLPKTTKTNIEKYNSYLTEVYNKYNNLLNRLEGEVKERFYSLFPSYNHGKLRKLKLELETFNIHILFNDYKNTYEKLGIDRLLYDINHFYKNDLDKVNNDILECINKYKEMGLHKLNFNYSPYCNKYVNVLINNKDDEKLIRDTFDKIYWKCPEIVTHIELNLKSIYQNNKKKFSKKVKEQDNKYFAKKNKKQLLEEYYSKVKEYNHCLEIDKLTIYEKFRNGELKVKDYQEDSVKKAYNLIKDTNANVDDYLNENIKKLSYSLKEYQNYNKYAYIIKDIRNKYKDREKYKGMYESLIKEIRKEEKNLTKLNKRINKMSNNMFMNDKAKEEQFSKLNIQINNLISTIKEKCEKLEDIRINEWVLTKLEDKSTYRDALLLAACNYNYMIELLKKENENLTLEEAQKVIVDLKNFIYSPYNTMINNISITEEKNMAFIISDCYKLLNINIKVEDLDDENIVNNLLSNIEIINLFNIMKQEQIDINDIDYIVQVDAINKKYGLQKS